jgi:hypothetical protein
MDPAIAHKLVEALDAELGRRHRRRDTDEGARWHEKHDDDPVG